MPDEGIPDTVAGHPCPFVTHGPGLRLGTFPTRYQAHVHGQEALRLPAPTLPPGARSAPSKPSGWLVAWGERVDGRTINLDGGEQITEGRGRRLPGQVRHQPPA
jgi:hypothetical protein